MLVPGNNHDKRWTTPRVASLLALVILPAHTSRGGPTPPFDREVDLATRHPLIDYVGGALRGNIWL
eukprot:1450318-Pleurochrysis_carterae.AAC.1